jgi:transposase
VANLLRLESNSQEVAVVFLGVDWAEEHHDVCLLDEQGKVLGRARVANSLEGVSRIHALVADHVEEPDAVVVGIETDRGPLVQALLAAGYQIYAINPLAVDRYRERHSVSGAKSDAGDAKVLADLVRTDRNNHRALAGDSQQIEAVKLLARAHQSLIQSRQRQVNQLRSALREFYPTALEAFKDDLGGRDAVAILEYATTPSRARSVSQAKLISALRKAGRERNLEARAVELQGILRQPHLEQPATLVEAYGLIVKSCVRMIRDFNAQIAELEQELTKSFELHPDAKLYLSLPGLGPVLGARVIGEFGDDPNRYLDAKGRRAYSGMAPITKASGTRHMVLARYARNRHLADACYLWAFASLKASPGAHQYYRALRARGKSHHQALRALGNRWVSILHGCLRHRTFYSEEVAWPITVAVAA